MLLGQANLRVEMADPTFRLVSHPSAITAYVLG
jgi:hypothetical protein